MSNSHVNPTILAAIAPWIPPYTNEAKALAVDRQYNADKNSGKLLRGKVAYEHQQEINVQSKLDGEPLDTRS